MENYILMIDSDSDLSFDLQEKLQIPVVYMPYIINGQEFFASLGKGGTLPEFYNKMRSGEVPVTASLSTPDYIDYFEPVLKSGKDILFIAFSSQLSSTIQNIYEAKNHLLSIYTERRFEVVDTLSISFPETLLILKAHELYTNGASMDEIVAWLEENKLKAQVYLTVDNLVYFKRGGRISGTAAFMGTLLDLKPLITLSKEGKLVPIEKIKGRKKALRAIINHLKENITDADQQQVIVFHADCENEANSVVAMLQKELPEIKDIRVDIVGEVIGAHCGPGTIGIAFMGKERPY